MAVSMKVNLSEQSKEKLERFYQANSGRFATKTALIRFAIDNIECLAGVIDAVDTEKEALVKQIQMLKEKIVEQKLELDVYRSKSESSNLKNTISTPVMNQENNSELAEIKEIVSAMEVMMSTRYQHEFRFEEPMEEPKKSLAYKSALSKINKEENKSNEKTPVKSEVKSRFKSRTAFDRI